MRPGISRIQSDGGLELVLRLRPVSTCGFEPCERRVIGCNVVEGSKALGPLVLRARQYIARRSSELNHAHHRQCLSRAYPDEPRLVGKMRRQDWRNPRIGQ